MESTCRSAPMRPRAVAVSEGVAERTGVLLAPPLWYGWSPFHLCYPGSFSLRPETLASVVEDVVNSLIHSGFKRVIIVSGHTTMNFVPVDPVALRVRQETGAYVAVADVGLIAKREIAGTLESAYDGHAGEWETSFMLHAYPDLVDMSDVPVNVPEVDKDLFPLTFPATRESTAIPTSSIRRWRNTADRASPGKARPVTRPWPRRRRGESYSRPWSATSTRWSWRHESTR